MASTIRFAEDLQARAVAYAGEVGISLNALVAVAVRDYIASRTPATKAPPDKVGAGLRRAKRRDDKERRKRKAKAKR